MCIRDRPGAAVEIEGKTITAVYPAGSELPAADKVVDCLLYTSIWRKSGTQSKPRFQ